MKIAVARDKNYVSPHFGHCEGFNIYNIKDNKILEKTFLPNPGHRPGFLPVFLKENDVDVVIAGGMGATAQQLFAENSIEVIVGAEGLCQEVVEKYLAGNLESSGSVCQEHRHEGSCHS